MTAHENRKSLSDISRDRATMRDVLPALLVLVVVQGSLIIVDPAAASGGWVLVWSLLPLLPAGWLVFAQLRSLRRADEYQRVVQLEAMSIGFGATVLLALAGGLLDAADVGDPAQLLQITFIVGIVTWVVALGVLSTRAR